MIEYKVYKRFSRRVLFVAKIDCCKNEPAPKKLGLAVKWAIENGANLEKANLQVANLKGANLEGADYEQGSA